jgi:ribose-phosphate pyrophosphokinase
VGAAVSEKDGTFWESERDGARSAFLLNEGDVMPYDLKLFSGNANRPLAEEIAQHLHVKLGDADVSRFSDGEVYVQINENVRGQDVFVVQPTCPPVNDNLMELLVMIDAFKRASARRITAVLPYYGYGRQDRKSQSRVPISAKLVADLITTAGASRVLSIDLHAGQIQGFFNIPVDHLFAAPVLIDYLVKNDLEDPVLVSPDAGGVERARANAKRLRAGLAIIDKRRDGPNVAVFMYLIGEVKGKDVVIIDDLIDTAGTLVQAAEAVKREGARRVLACGVHPVLSGPAIRRITSSDLEELIITNSIPLPPEKRLPNVHVLSVAPLLAEAMRRIHDEESVSTLFV